MVDRRTRPLDPAAIRLHRTGQGTPGASRGATALLPAGDLYRHCERSEAISIPICTSMEIARMPPGLALGSLRCSQ